MAHPELGSKILDDVLERSVEYAKVETQARLEGRNMTMVLSPDKKATTPPKKAQPRPNGDAEPTATTPSCRSDGPSADRRSTSQRRRSRRPPSATPRAQPHRRNHPCRR